MLEILLENDFLSAIIAFALILIPAIIIHELGHFFAAKIVGINVLEFGVGFPPRMVRLFTWGETEFTLNWLPIGGFVRPLGEDMIGPVQEEAELDAEDDDLEKPKNTDYYISEREELLARGVPEDKLMSVNEAKPLPRIFFMTAGAFSNFVTAIFLFIVIALLGLPHIVGGRMQLVNIPPSSIFAGTQAERGDAVELINGNYFGGTQDFIETMFTLNGQNVVLTMRSLETNENYELTVTPNATDARGYVFISGVAPESPADDAGLLAGDLITAVDGKSLPALTNPILALQQLTEEAVGSAMQLTILRDGSTFETALAPRENPPKGEGRVGIIIDAQYVTNDGVRYAEGVAQQELIPLPFGESVQYGFTHFADVIKLIVSIPGQIISGAISPEEARPVSIIGISQVGGQFLKQSVEQGSPVIILNFIAMVSIFLGVTNLLPLPPLDGGRIVFVIIEMVRGKPVSPKIEGLIQRVGIAFLLGLGLLVILYDIFNPFVLPQ